MPGICCTRVLAFLPNERRMEGLLCTPLRCGHAELARARIRWRAQLLCAPMNANMLGNHHVLVHGDCTRNAERETCAHKQRAPHGTKKAFSECCFCTCRALSTCSRAEVRASQLRLMGLGTAGRRTLAAAAALGGTPSLHSSLDHTAPMLLPFRHHC